MHLACRAVAFAFVTLICSCSRSVHLELPSGTPVQLITSHENPGTTLTESKEVLLQPETADYRRLQEWLTDNQTGWSQSLSTNPGGGIVVHAGKLSLQFVGTAVFTWTDKGQFQKNIREDDYAFLKKPAGI